MNFIDKFNVYDTNKQWHTVSVRYGTYQKVTEEWLKNNIGGDFHCFGNYWHFKEQNDAIVFSLCWKD